MIKRKIKTVLFFMISVLLISSCGRQTSIQDAAKGEKIGKKYPAETEDTESADTDCPDTETSNGENITNPPTGSSKKITSTGSENGGVDIIAVETGHYTDYYWDDGSEHAAAYLKYPYMRLSEADSRIYPRLQTAVSELMNERKARKLLAYADMVEAAKEAYAAEPDCTSVFEATETVTVRRADSKVLSLMFDGYYYMGGAHGTPYAEGIVFDSITGKSLELTDVVSDIELLPELVEARLESYWGMTYFYEDLDMAAYFDENITSIQWVLDYYGITFYFNPYEIAPYATGIVTVTVPFSDYPELFKEEYREAPADYSVEIPQGKPFFYDVDGDGILDSIVVSAAEGGYDYYTPQMIQLNGMQYIDDMGAFEIEPVLMHTADGKNYLYIEQQFSEDSHVYSVYNVSGGTVEKIDDIYEGQRAGYDAEANVWVRQIPTDPNCFNLETYIWLIGNVCGYDSYHIGKDGMPVKDHDWYIISDNIEFTLLRDLTARIVSNDGKGSGKTGLKTGDKVTYYRTDGESWADLLLQDESIVRVTLQYTDDCWTIDGVDIEELFDGITYGY